MSSLSSGGDRAASLGGPTSRSALSPGKHELPPVPKRAMAAQKVATGLADRRRPLPQTKDALLLADGKTHRILEVNASALRITGYQRAELIGAPLSKLVSPEDRDAQRTRYAALATEASLISQARFRRKGGEPIEVEIEQRHLNDGRILAVVRSSSQGGRGEGQFTQSLSRFDLFVTTVDREGRITYANPALRSLTGWGVDDLMGMSVYQVLPVGPLPEEPGVLSDVFLAADLEHPVITEVTTHNGERRSVVVSATRMDDDRGETIGAAIFGQDVTQERAAHSELELILREREEVAVAISRVRPEESPEATAAAICRELRRLHGVDFAVLVVFSPDGGAVVLASDSPPIPQLAAGKRIPEPRAKYLLERATAGPWVEGWHQRDEDGAYGEALTRVRVQGASYAPIRYGEDTLGLILAGSYDSGSLESMVERLPAIAEFGSAASALLALDLRADRMLAERRSSLKSIIDNRAFHPVFQPIVDVHSRRVVGYEALTRFADGVSPDTRFPTAWTLGLGAELEFATLERAIAVSRGLPPGLWLNVNLSPSLLSHARDLRALLDRANRPFVVEITEHEVITDYGAVRDALTNLKPIKVAVDDAGAGMASFRQIVELQPDFLKVDIGLVRGVDADPARQAMILALSHFALATHCELIAEGVETRRESETLASLGVDLAQGYWYGRPVVLDRILAAARTDHLRVAV